MPNAFLAMFVVPTSAFPLEYDTPFVLWLCLLATAMGSRLLRVLRLPEEDLTRLERGSLCAGVGLGLLSNVALLLGLLSLLTPTNVEIALALLTLLFSRDMVRVLRSLSKSVSSQWHGFKQRAGSPFSSLSPAYILYLISYIFLLLLTFFQSLCPCTDADGLAYHLRAPKLWLQSGSLEFLPTLTHTNSPMGVEMLYALGLAAWSDTAAKLIHFALGLLALLAIYALGRRLYSSRVGLAAAAFFALGLPKAPVLALFTYAYIDLGIALEVICAAIAWFAWQRSGRSGWLIISALCAGFGFAFKLTGVLFILTFALLTWREEHLRKSAKAENQPNSSSLSEEALTRGLPQNSPSPSEERAPRGGVHKWTPGVRFLCVGIMPALPWLLRSWKLTGNPVYPLFPACSRPAIGALRTDTPLTPTCACTTGAAGIRIGVPRSGLVCWRA